MEDGQSWVRRLSPSGATAALKPSCLPETWNRAVAGLGIGPALWVVEFSRELAPLALDPDIPSTRRQAAAEEARTTAEAVVLEALLALDRGLPAPMVVPLEMTQRLAGTVRQRIPLERVLTFERASHARVSEVLLTEFQRLVPPEEQAAGFTELSRFLVDFVTGFALATTAAYTAEEQAWLTSIDGARGEWVRRVLDGAGADPDVTSRLMYELSNRTHVGLIVRRDKTTADPSGSVDSAAARVLTRLGAVRHLIIPAGDNEVWAWGGFLSSENIDFTSTDAEGSGIHLAVGTPREGIEGFRRTHREARTASDLDSLRGTHDEQGTITFFREVRLIALLALDLAAARAFVREELGPLASARESQLRETVRVYLECNCSPAGAAARLNVVKNTVVYRVRRAEELLGRSVRDDQGMLWAALHLVSVIGLDENDPST